MRKILLLLFPIILQAQQPIPISQPYLFKKYITVNDSVKASLYKQGGDTLGTKLYIRQIASVSVNGKKDKSDTIDKTGYARNWQLQHAFDTANISPFDSVIFKNFSASGYKPGKVWYENGLLNIASHYPGVSNQVGTELWMDSCRNNTGSTILNGRVVRIIGAQGTRPTIALASYSTNDSSDAMIGVATMDITTNHSGIVTTFGAVRDINTSSFSAGDTLYLSYSGRLTKTKPSIGMAIRIGYCTYSHSQHGLIYVTIERCNDIRTSTRTTITGILKGSNGNIAQAVAGTDYLKDSTHFKQKSDSINLTGFTTINRFNDSLSDTRTTLNEKINRLDSNKVTSGGYATPKLVRDSVANKVRYTGSLTTNKVIVGNGTNSIKVGIDAVDYINGSSFYSFGRQYLKDFDAQISKINTSTANSILKIVWIGDSWTSQGNITNDLSVRLRNRLGNSGVGYIGASTLTNLINTGDGFGFTRTITGTWTNQTSTVGASISTALSTDVSTPAKIQWYGYATDIILHYVQKPGGGKFTWQLNLGTATEVNTDGVLSIQYVTITSGNTDYTHYATVNITNAGSTGVEICGIEYKRAKNGVVLNNLGLSGSTSGQWAAANATAFQSAMTQIAPNMAVICLGVNDAVGGVTPSQYIANISTIITNIRTSKPYCDIVLFSPSDIGESTTYPISDYVYQLRLLAMTNNYCFIDNYSLLGNYTAANARTLMTNTTHPNAAGGMLMSSNFEKLIINDQYVRYIGTNIFNGLGPGANLTTGTSNIINGYLSGYYIKSGVGNTSNGAASLFSLILKDYNLADGYASLYNTTESNNIGVGAFSGKYQTNLKNRLYINSLDRTNLLGDTTKSIIYGNQNTTVANQKLYLNAGYTYLAGSININGGLNISNPDSLFKINNAKPTAKAMDTTGIYALATKNMLLAKANLTGAAFTGDVTYKYRHAVAHADSIIGYLVGGTQNIYYKVNPSGNAITDTVGITVAGDSIYIQKSGDYRIVYRISSSTTNANDYIRHRMKKNNTFFSPMLGPFITVSNGSTTTIPTDECTWYLKGLTAGDWLSFYITNATGNRAISITNFYFYIEKLPK